MSFIPEGFIIPTNYENLSQGSAKAYVGLANGQPFRFFQEDILSLKKSEEAGYEVYEKKDMVEFLLDAKSKNALRCDPHTFLAHPEILADYRKWKEGKISNFTDIQEWAAISHGEMGMIIAAGFSTVEQIAEATKERIDELGVYGEAIRRKAEQHVNSKKKAIRQEDQTNELIELKKQLADKNKEVSELSATMSEFQKQLAEFGSLKTELETANKKKAGVQK